MSSSSENEDPIFSGTREDYPKRQAAKMPRPTHVYNILNSRSLGFLKRPLGFTDSVASTLYTSFNEVEHSTCCNNYDQYWGGIFNLEFNLDGKLLVAACEGKQILLYDASNQKHLTTIENAHLNCVNCIKFLDDYSFATGSDDSLIKLWDIRNLRSSKKTLNGHTNWVKNIEWSRQDNVMVTSAFDGTVYTWNLNEFTENNMQYEKVLLMSGLMRMKLTPDGTKMVITTTGGFIMVIHNLNLLSLARDLTNFKPALYHLMQASAQGFPAATIHNHLFSPSRSRNRIEFIDDFPNDAEVISSLAIHPHGWSAVTRNLNSEENEEWTAVHDIQDRDEKDYEDAYFYAEENEPESMPINESGPSQRPTDLWLGYVNFEDYQTINTVYWQATQETELVNSGLIGTSDYYAMDLQNKNKIIKNLKRMTHYIKEKNVGKGFIKEVCFSSDGRIICSPFDKGLRLLGFSDSCQEMSDCVPDSPKELTNIVEMNDYHRDIVVSCKFSPVHYQLVTGCLGSQIKWYQPVL